MSIQNSKNEKVDTAYLLHEYDALVSCKSLGFFNCCEMVSIFLIHKKTGKVYNVYTIFSFEERICVQERTENLTNKLIPVTAEFSLGITKKIQQVNSIRTVYEKLCEERSGPVIDIGGGVLQIGQLEAVPKVFVQKDSTKTVLFNRVLKNNFRNGSYVLEFFDTYKYLTKVLNSGQLKQLTSEIYQIVPIDLLSVSDRIGNFVFQFPSVSTGVSYRPANDEMLLHYHVSVDERLENDFQFQLQSEILYDDTVIGFEVADCQKNMSDFSFQMGDSSHLCRTTLIDLKHHLILSRQETSFMRQLSVSLHFRSQYGELREIYDDAGLVKEWVETEYADNNIHINQPVVREREDFIESRQYKRRIEDLYRRREFRSYGIVNEKDKALQDVIALMNTVDNGKVYLWDPYLSAEDLLQTWYRTKTHGILFLAITSGATCPGATADWIEKQKETLEKGSNHYGIRLEFRCQWKNHGYNFHDRFLMVINKNKTPQVWSLGTSLNNLGARHHVIQSVEHPQMIIDSFEQLWDKLDAQECLVYRKGI
ncbi:MAG: hypothetical protein LUI10_12545 [Lachnospiraceae bacterium]|nr:hypothetical protein [Lachnospiraceae bacterium]